LIDEQMVHHLQSIQISPDLLPAIRKTYLADISCFTADHVQERKALEARKRKLDEKEVNVWRAFTEHGMRPHVYEALAKEVQEERERLENLIRQAETTHADYVADVDAALRIVSEIGERFGKCALPQQRDILLQMVERVVIDAAGIIQYIQWKPPLCYLSSLKQNTTNGKSKTKSARKAKTSGVSAGSLPIKRGGPKGTQVEPNHSSIITDFAQFVELTAYPQRSALEPLLTSD
jgi:hypothetical protein